MDELMAGYMVAIEENKFNTDLRIIHPQNSNFLAPCLDSSRKILPIPSRFAALPYRKSEPQSIVFLDLKRLMEMMAAKHIASPTSDGTRSRIPAPRIIIPLRRSTK